MSYPVYEIQRLVIRYGAYAGLRHAYRQGYSIHDAMLAHCGYVPRSLKA